MARYIGKKNRIARKFGANIFGRARNPLLHKPNPPGQHGARHRKKSDFGLQLHEKQKLKAVYGMLSEKQLVNYFKKAYSKPGVTAQLLIEQLECRLDTVVYKLKLAPTIFAAQQLIAHGHVEINGKKVDIRSCQVKPGQTVSIREKSKNLRLVTDALHGTNREVPPYLALNVEALSGQLLAMPQIDQMQWPIEINVPEVCDFLAHSN
jgi:small subunit ribosomal protein S4